MLHAFVSIIYGIIILVGGTIGHIKAQSLPSLIMGTIFGLLFIGLGVAFLKQSVIARFTAIFASILLTVFFIYRFTLTGQFMPAGLMTILSLGAAATFIFGARTKSYC